MMFPRVLLIVVAGLLLADASTASAQKQKAPARTQPPAPAANTFVTPPRPELPAPRELRAAYARGTRAENGAPGPKYFSNRIAYAIEAQVDPAARTLKGMERVTFANGSPDTLRTLAIKLIQNMYRPGAVHALELAPEALRGGIRMSRLDINGAPALTADELAEKPEKETESAYSIGGGGFAPGSNVKRLGTTWIVRLRAPLAPGASLTMEAAWSFELPDATLFPNRMGTLGDGAAFIGSWYPKIAEYDDLRGWDLSPHDDWHEFYHSYGDYDVRITVPGGSGVWCTGALTNPRDVLSADVSARLAAAAAVDTVVHVVTAEDLPRGAYASGKQPWHFSATNVPDVAFAVSPVHVWDATSIETAPGHRVLASAVYRPGTKSFEVAAQEARATIGFLSTRMPAVPYPWPTITVFHGVEGMEYPMIVNDGSMDNRIADVYVHSHEISHQYMPFLVSTDEYRNAWLDEGMAYFLPVELQKELSGYDHRLRAVSTYSRFAGREADYPLIMPTSAMPGGDDFMIHSYQKAAVAYDMLRATVGEQVFGTAMEEFVKRWMGKHPTPWDFFHTFDDVAKRDLAWFWKPWFFDFGTVPDLAIDKVERTSDGTVVKVRRIGGMPVPIDLTITFEDGTTKHVLHDPSVWARGAETISATISSNVRVTELRLGTPLIPDADPANNVWKP